MEVRLENILTVDIKGNQSHDELSTYIQAKQEAALIRHLACTIQVRNEELGHQHPLFSFIQNTPTLEDVDFYSMNGNASIDAFLDAIIQNHSIHSIRLHEIDCSAYAIQKLLERKMKWEVSDCRFLGHPYTLNESTSNIEELDIQSNDLSVMDFMARIRSWPFLRQLSIDFELNLHLLEHIIPAAPILQELTMNNFDFHDPDELLSCATIVFNAPSPDLKWHLDDCNFHPKTMAVLETIVKSENAKLMRFQFTLLNKSNNDIYQVLRTIMSESSCVGNLDISDEHGDRMLEILPLLRQEQPSYYPCTSIHLTIHTDCLQRYRDIINSIQHWSLRVKKLFLRFAFHGYFGRPGRPFLRTELIQAVRKNLHLQLVELNVEAVLYHDDENTKNADEQCHASLERYCERNRKLQMLDKPETIPLEVWPYVYHLVSRGGADMLYCQLHNSGNTQKNTLVLHFYAFIHRKNTCAPPP